MSALPRPDVTGPARILNDALHDLHHRAGWPSLRTLAKETGVSHTTVSKVFSSPALPPWGTLELLVEAMDGDTTAFHDLWLAASTPTTPESRPAPRIAGRRTELAAVRRHLETGTGLLLVTGEAGIGKTALVEAAASTSTAVVVTSNCFPLSSETPLMPLVDVLRALHARHGGTTFNAALAQAPEYVTEEVSRLLPEMGVHVTADLTGEWARHRLLGALQSLLTAWPTLEPLGVVLEDLHWADAATLDLLEHFTRRPDSLPIVATWRLGDPGTQRVNADWFSRVRSALPVPELALSPLTRAETAEQLARIAPSMNADTVFARTRGHPLFTAQLAAHRSGSELPSVLADLLDARLGELDGRIWRLARALGVADRPLDVDVLSTAAGVDREAAVAGLGTLARRRLLDRSTGESVSLGHPLLAEAVRRRLLPGEGLDQHRALAEALSRAPYPEPAEVATHWMAAGDVVQEVDWRVKAAHSAAHRYDRAQEAEQWLRVLEVWPAHQARSEPPPVRHETAYFAAMDALQGALQFDRAAELSDAAESVLQTTDDAVRAELLRRTAVYRGQREGSDVGTALLDQALVLYDRLPVCAGLVWARDWKQNLLRDEGDFDGSFRMAQAAVEAASIVGDPSLTRRMMSRVAWHVGVRGSLDEARQVLDEADHEVRPGTDPQGDIRRAVIETDLMLICGSPADQALAAGREGMAVAQALGIDSYDVLLIRLNTAYALLTAGRVGQASELMTEAPGELTDLDRWPVYLLRAVIDGLGGNVVQAADRIDRLWDAMARNWARDVDIMVLTETVNAWRPAVERNPNRLIAALDLLVGSAPTTLVAPAIVAAARAAADVQLGPDEAVELRERLCDIHNRSRWARSSHAREPHIAAHAAAWEAEMSRLMHTDAVDQWVRAAKHWDRMSRPHDAAYCRWRGAQVALREDQGTVASRLLRSAAIDAHEHVPLSRAIARTASRGH